MTEGGQRHMVRCGVVFHFSCPISRHLYILLSVADSGSGGRLCNLNKKHKYTIYACSEMRGRKGYANLLYTRLTKQIKSHINWHQLNVPAKSQAAEFAILCTHRRHAGIKVCVCVWPVRWCSFVLPLVRWAHGQLSRTT
jgi:hypothetical protein